MSGSQERLVGPPTEIAGYQRPALSGGRSPLPRTERARMEAATAAASAALAPPAAAAVDDGHLARRDRSRRAAVLEATPLRDVGRRQRIFRRLLGAADALTALGAVVVALDEVGGRVLLPWAVLVVPLMVLASKAAGLYDKDELVIDHSTLNELPRLVNVATLVALVVWLGRRYLVSGQPQTLNLLALWLLLIFGLLVARTAARRLAQSVAPVERCLLIGRRSVYDRLQARVGGYRGVSLVRQLDAAELAADHNRLLAVVARDHVHRIIIDTDATSSAVTLDTVRLANATGLQVSLLPTILGAVGGSVVFDDIGGLVLMGVPRFGLTRSSLLLKRSFDLVGSTLVLVFAAPVMGLIALAIKLDSRGAVLFRQTRVGRNDAPFQMLKFRSMVEGADAMKDSLRHANEADGLFKIENDPRITRTGRLLRRTGLDELPQLLNVLGGSMSLVGPRPLVVDEDRKVTGFDRRRLHLTPGITGRWQTLGAARVPLAEMVKIDYLYIANWSPWLDFRIIVETMGFLARRGGQ